MSRVTISMKAARAIDAYLEWSRQVEVEPALTRTAAVPLSDWFELRRAMEPKRKPRRPSAKAPRPGEPGAPLSKKAQKREHRASIREAVFKRAGSRCEGPWAHWGLITPAEWPDTRCVNAPTDLSHLFGRGKGRLPESVRTCAAWCRQCHDKFGANDPSAAAWWRFIAWWLRSRGYHFEAEKADARAAFVETRSTLGAGLKERNNA